MSENFIVKTSSLQANRLLMGGFRSGEIQTIYAAAGSGAQVLLLSAVKDALSKGLKTTYFDFVKNVSFEAIKANDLDPDSEMFRLYRRRPFHSVESTIRYISSESEKLDADFVVLDFSQSNRAKILDRAWGQSNSIGSYSRTLAQLVSYNKWAMVVILPITSFHWRPYGAVTAGRGGTGTLSLSRGTKSTTIAFLQKNGFPYAVNVADELARDFIESPTYCQTARDRKHSCTDAVPENIRNRIFKKDFHFYELVDILNGDEALFSDMKALLSADAESVLANSMADKLGIQSGREFEVIDKTKRILSFDGEIGSFDDMDARRAEAVVDIWARTLDKAGISVDFAHADEQTIMNVGRTLGLDSSAAAAFAGVPIEDILG